MGEEQLVVRLVWDHEAVGSSPTSHTKYRCRGVYAYFDLVETDALSAYCLVLLNNKKV